MFVAGLLLRFRALHSLECSVQCSNHSKSRWKWDMSRLLLSEAGFFGDLDGEAKMADEECCQEP